MHEATFVRSLKEGDCVLFLGKNRILAEKPKKLGRGLSELKFSCGSKFVVEGNKAFRLTDKTCA